MILINNNAIIPHIVCESRELHLSCCEISLRYVSFRFYNYQLLLSDMYPIAILQLDLN